MRQCGFLLKALDNEQKEEPEIPKPMADNDEKLEDVKDDSVK